MVENENIEKESKLADKQWYIVTAYSLHEMKVAENLRKRMESQGFSDHLFNVLVANQEVDVMKDGQKTGKTRLKNQYPGYIFVEMIMTDRTWYIVRNTPGVTGIVGSSGGGQKPTPVTKEEIEPVLKRMGIIDQSMYERYNINDRIKVIRGPLEGTEGRILSLDKETGACQVETTFFGRATKVDVDFSDIEKI